MTDNIIDFDAHRIRLYLTETVGQFINDPPDTLYQCGYLAAIIAIYNEGLSGRADDRVKLARDVLAAATKRVEA